MKVRKLLNLFLLTATVGFFSYSCGNDDDTDIDVTVPATNQDVYAAGRENYVAKYWKNGSAVVLGKGSSASDANSIIVVGNDVHIVGWEINSAGKYVAKYWKNGVATDLTDGSKDARASDIYIDGNDVYIAGQEIGTGGVGYIAKYWKNGVAINLTDESQNAAASGIAVYKNDVYVIGERRLQSWTNPIACYWKNGVLKDLADQSTYAADQDIAVSNNDIVMMWSASYSSSGQLKTQYSKNFSTPVNVQDGTPSFRGSSVTISDNDIYISGTGLAANGSDFTAKYLKNGVPVTLMNVAGDSEALSISVSGSDVFVGGYQHISSPAGKATYWKNGDAVSLTDGSSEGLIRKIVVVNK